MDVKALASGGRSEHPIVGDPAVCRAAERAARSSGARYHRTPAARMGEDGSLRQGLSGGLGRAEHWRDCRRLRRCSLSCARRMLRSRQPMRQQG
jgi:hypothetical protein